MVNIVIDQIIAIAKEAGERILEVYNRNNFSTKYKRDTSPLTIADKNSHDFITTSLRKFYPRIPRISEEDNGISYEERKNCRYFWLIDPLDGTKEFIKKIPEFTINIALIYNNSPYFGIIYLPVSGEVFYAKKGLGSYKIDSQGRKTKLPIQENNSEGKIRVIVTRSHKTKELEIYLENLKEKFQKIEPISIGSSLKFCLIAEGEANIYPRFGNTMEWDTAAGQIIVEEAGGAVIDMTTNNALEYNKEKLLNNYFIVYNSASVCNDLRNRAVK